MATDQSAEGDDVGSEFLKNFSEWVKSDEAKSLVMELNESLNDFAKQTPRGLAVLTVANLEVQLWRKIKHKLPHWDMPPTGKKTTPHKVGELLFGTEEKSGELAFVSQCRMAYCLGIIGPINLRDLERIANIRNLLAHRPSVRSFDHPDIKSICDKLETLRHMEAMRTPDSKPLPVPAEQMTSQEVFSQTALNLGLCLAMESGLNKLISLSPKLQGENAALDFSFLVF